MKENVLIEITTIKQLVHNWKDAYYNYYREHYDNTFGEWGFLAEDLREEIELQVFPFIKRLCVCEHITAEEAGSLIKDVLSEVFILIRDMDKYEESFKPMKLVIWYPS